MSGDVWFLQTLHLKKEVVRFVTVATGECQRENLRVVPGYQWKSKVEAMNACENLDKPGQWSLVAYEFNDCTTAFRDDLLAQNIIDVPTNQPSITQSTYQNGVLLTNGNIIYNNPSSIKARPIFCMRSKS